MKAKLIFIISIVIFATMGFLQQSKLFYLASSIAATLLCIYILLEAIKKPVSNRLGNLHAIMSVVGLLILALCIPTFIPKASYGNMDANAFAADIKAVFLVGFGFLIFALAQILFLLSVTKKINR